MVHMTDSAEFDPDNLAEEMTEEVINIISKTFGQNFSEDIDDSDMESAKEKTKGILTELRSFQQSDPDEEEAIQFLLEKYNETAARALGLNTSDLDSLEGLEVIFEQIDSKLSKFRAEGESFGYPQYFDTVENVADELIEQEDYRDYLNTIREGWEKIGEKKEQRMFARYDSDLWYIFGNPEVENSSTVEEYLGMYEDYCEQFKTLSPFIIYSVNVIKTGDGELDNRLNDNLHNLVDMCRTRDRIKVFAEAIDNDRRNAITHDDYFIDPIEETVQLAVGGEDEVFSYSEVRDLAVEARCAAQSLFIFSVLSEHRANLRELSEIQDEIDGET
ncbi:hypothetical protein SAMN06264867_11029 [Halorubrum cibi]|uniref:Uncharacterized protein n=2 Tax=Halorubrum cibi TaxID=413815 RepID=A0A521EC95_9EURY|nr:hypothetical protein SAMN06264867_11029 [Halorubrum cibi]